VGAGFEPDVQKRIGVVVLTAVDGVVGHAIVGPQKVAAAHPVEVVGPATADHDVVALPAIDGVRAVPARDTVLAEPTRERGIAR